MRYVICDIDGCCLNSEARIQYLLDGDYATYSEMWETDVPIPQGVFVYRQFMRNRLLNIVFLTSRFELARETTTSQLQRLFPGEEFQLLMRRDGDNREDAEVKVEALATHGMSAENIFIAFDDRNVICEAYRKLGIVAYQTATGY